MAGLSRPRGGLRCSRMAFEVENCHESRWPDTYLLYFVTS
jgi:hypothetical protein